MFKSFPLTLKQWGRESPVVFVLSMVVSILVGFCFWIALGVFVNDESLVQVVPAHATLTDDRRWVEVQESQEDTRCIRLTTHLVYPANGSPTEQRKYTSLGSEINGLPFPNAVRDYSIRLIVPHDMTGDWYYVERGFESCPPLYLVHWTYTTTPPLLLKLGDAQQVTLPKQGGSTPP